MPSPDKQSGTVKTSMEILSELFSTFNAEPPVIVKKEKHDSKNHKKSKKKHKHKEKKSKKKSHKRKHSSTGSSESELDLAEILIKTERQSPEKKFKLKHKNDEDKVSCKLEPDNGTEAEDEQLKTSYEQKPDVIKVKFEDDVKKKKIHKRKHKQKDKDKSPKSKSGSPHRSKDKSVISSKHAHVHEKSTKRTDEYKTHKHKSAKTDKHKDIHSCDYKDKHFEKDQRGGDSNYNNRDYDHKSHRHHQYYKDALSERDDNKYYFYDNDERSKLSKDRYKSSSSHDKCKERRRRERSLSPERSVSQIDKKKLLEIARKNAIQMMKSGNLPGALNLGPQAQEKVIAAIKSGGKTIEELTDFCKSLSRKEELGELSSVSDEIGSESEADAPFHHPFQIKERPSSITMNIKNSVPLPLKSTQERVSELRMQFPVSSGQQHRRTESEWVPVSPKKTEVATPSAPKAAEFNSKPVVPAPVAAPAVVPASVPIAEPSPVPSVFPSEQQNIDIASIVSQRLSAMRKLQENPNDSQAICEIYRAQKEVNSWAESKQIGQFTGSTGAQILSQAELNAGYQAWARKDQLQTAAPVSGGMGMHLLQKMGWKPGEGLGKEKTGALEPLLLEVKLDKKGIVAKEEEKRKQAKVQKGGANKINVQGKHPVSLLGEYASKHKLGAPEYSVCYECGPDHKKNFLFKVVVNGVEYKPNVASPNKKEAKANAANVCLQYLGLLPTVT